jgi:major type 1 subunit fimbrin (pilin)
LLTLLLGGQAAMAQSDCRIEGAASNARLPLRLDFPGKDFMLDPSLPIGATIGKLTLKAAPVRIACDVPGRHELDYRAPRADAAGIVATDLRGIGYRLTRHRAGRASAFPHTRSQTAPLRDDLEADSYELAFVKTDAVSAAGSLDRAPDIGAVTSRQMGPLLSIGMGRMNFKAATCSSTDVTVEMGKQAISAFAGVGPAKTSPRPFFIHLARCPAGLRAIQYQLDAVTPIVDAAQSVIALDGAASARGVGIQLLDQYGAPLPLATPLTLSDYHPGSGGHYKIPLQARYYRLSDPLRAGSVRAAMTFTISYQ